MHRSIIRKTRRIVNTMRVSSLFLFFLCVHNCGALSLTGWLKRIPLASRFTTTGRNTASPIATTRITGTPPSWEALALSLQNNNESTVEPLVTLYRDTNGWCPFCERVWVALHVKQIPYQETLVSLQNKPQWYKQLVPTTLVPAVLFHGSSNDGDKDTKNERRIVWESMDILKALDDEFPDTPKLVWETPEFDAALQMSSDLFSAGFSYQFATRNETLSEQDVQEKRLAFLAKLDELDQALEAASSDGPFRLGANFTAVDASMIPGLERWRYQLPITLGVDILQDRPHLQAWFASMDAYAPYSNRVAGDEYSWVATASQFLRFFGGGEEKPKIAAAIERADATAKDLSDGFADAAVEGGEVAAEFSLEAARKLVSNHEAVVQDCTRKEPQSQKHISRASNETTADAMLRHVTSILVEYPEHPVEAARTAAMVELENDVEGKTDAAIAARTVASRLCVPRDLGGPAAKTLRAVLSITANRLEEQATMKDSI